MSWTEVKKAPKKRRCQCENVNLPNQSEHILRSDKYIHSKKEFCQSFWHIRETPECNKLEECLVENDAEATAAQASPSGSQKCSSKVIVGIVSLNGYTARYTNCKDFLHAEDFLQKDEKLLTHINQSKDKELTLYLTLLPCHYSSNNNKKSCCKELKNFYETRLVPKNIKMTIVGAYPYRAHWEILTEEEKLKMGDKIKNAREGIKFLKDHIRAFNKEDWGFISSLSDYNMEYSASREKMDEFTAEVIEKFSK